MTSNNSLKSKKVVLKELNSAFKGIIHNYKYINSLSKGEEEIIPSAQWLLDNIYLIEKEYKEIKFNLPREYYDSKDSHIYEFTKEYVIDSSAILNEEDMESFIKSLNYELTMGELWAFPLMARAALIILLAYITNSIAVIQKQRAAAKKLGYTIIENIKEGNIEKLLLKLEAKYPKRRNIIDQKINNDKEKFMGEDVSLNDGMFSVEFVDKIFMVLKDNSIEDKRIYDFILDRLEKQKDEVELDKLFIEENLRQGTIENYIANIITSLRKIESINWRKFFERTSKIERILNYDPAEVYSKMDFETKDYYRHKIEEIARRSGRTEINIVNLILELCRREENDEDYKKHVGYYIIDEGQKELLAKLSFRGRIDNYINPQFYIWAILIMSVVTNLLIVFLTFISKQSYGFGMYFLEFLILLMPAVEISIIVINWALSKNPQIKVVPAVSCDEEMLERNKTIIVIPAIIASKQRLAELLAELEIYYLGNKDKNIFFALLGDFKDSEKEINLDEDRINDFGLRKIKELNEKYFPIDRPQFFFLNRKQVFNENEGVYMGRERKRGKLEEFINLIKGNSDHTYNVVSSDISILHDAKYIITLDADTILPIDAGKRLIGKMAHILNRPVIQDSIIVRGYGIMQPKVGVKLKDKYKTKFSEIFAGNAGVDGYSTATFDLYQDMFNEGIYIGKGILDIDIFYNIVNGQIPRNKVLSHDLLEGALARCALVSDIEVIEGYPSTYEASCQRLHRWTRGDWQVAEWIFNKKISVLSRWKFFDNLRRSLLAPSLLLAYLIALAAYKNMARIIIMLCLVGILPIIFTIIDFVVTPKNRIYGTFKSFKQVVLILSFLPYQAYLMIDAICRTLYRLLVSHKHLLQWIPSEEAEKGVKNSQGQYYIRMWISPVIALVVAVISFSRSYTIGLINLPVVVLWATSPLIAYNISKTIKIKEKEIEKGSNNFLRMLARRIWAYYEDFVNKENNYLAPDNYQENPYRGEAHRTSPTNMGMALISDLIAYHMSYITLGTLIDRLENTLSSMEKLDKYRGHFYNWYDTTSCKTLWPRYISTVDSGNLLGYLMIIKKELENIKNEPIIRKEEITSLEDTYEILNDTGLKINSNINKIIMKDYKEILDQQLELINKAIAEGENSDLNQESRYWLVKQQNSIKEKINFYLYIFEGIDNILINLLNNKSVLSLNEIINFMEAYGENEDDKELAECRLKCLKDFAARIDKLIEKINKLILEMDFKFLYNEKRGLFAIGYNYEEDSLGESYYDLLASEARAISFIAIARGEVPKDHWYKLSRNMAKSFGYKTLASWSGTMFEYFMPYQIMKSYKNTIWDLTYDSVIKSQIHYAKQKGVPWGISESSYYHFDLDKNYQYKAFGVPGVGLKSGLEDELVVSPYSTIMTLPYEGEKAIENLQKLKSYGAYGRYGFMEAIDFSKGVEKYQLVQSYMVHHLGMSLMALDNYLNNNILKEIFHSIPEIKSAELLLQEKIPERITFERIVDISEKKKTVQKENFIPRVISAHSDDLKTCLLSNGSYSLMITDLGTGYSKDKFKMLYRWKGDSTTDSHGMFFYIKNLNSNEYWSAAYEPAKKTCDDEYEIFSLDKCLFHKINGSIESNYEIVISSEDNVEIRKIILKNNGDKKRIVEVTSYMEVTLTTFEADIVHPSFSNLFISTKYEEDTLLANRRARSKKDLSPWAFHKVVVDGGLEGPISYETSRVNFIGRDRSLKDPRVMDNDTPLDNTEGTVLDPIFSLRASIKLEPHETREIYFITGMTANKIDALDLSKKYSSIKLLQRVEGEFSYSTSLELEYIGIKSVQANLYQELASYILFINKGRENREKYIKNIKFHQEDLWSFGISGDLPIVLLIIKSDEDIALLRQMLNMHYYWDALGLTTDLIIYNEEAVSYEEPMQKRIISTINSSLSKDSMNKKGGIYLHNKATMSLDILEFLMGIAALYINSSKGNLIAQLEEASSEKQNIFIRHKELEDIKEKLYLNIVHNNEKNENINKNEKEEYNVDDLRGKTIIGNDLKVTEELNFFNGYGGFKRGSGSYSIRLNNFLNTPAPWINVISNEDFGFHISEVGSSYTWCGNSRENKLTPWSNDWVVDPLSEALYIRDDGSRMYFSITPQPVRDGGVYDIEHSFGYSTFKHTAQDISGESTYFCPKGEKIKLCKVTLENKSSEDKGLTLFYYSQLVLGVYSYKSCKQVHTDIEENFVCGQNPFNTYFGKLKTFLTINGCSSLSFSGDRKEFIGVGNDLSNPNALKYDKLSNNVGAVFDPCLSVAGKITLRAGEKKELVVVLGCYEEKNKIKEAIIKYSNIDNVNQELNNVKLYWDKFLGRIKVRTPDKSMDYLLNGWLMYQTYSCRYLSRTAFYQSGGAYGFRDQLQDSLSLGILDADITRQQILRSASRQYVEGDVQHWWHPIVMSGIRTRFSDDLLWLPYVTIEYIKATGDYSILTEKVKYLQDEPLKEGEDERYTIVNTSSQEGTIYEHCIKATDRALKFGENNLPLMGSGDWNDGMSTVGNEGKGESVWLAWFLYTILNGFKPLCEFMSDDKKLKAYTEYKEFIKENIEKNAWDGGWYRRAYFDDGTPLGSRENEECQIDSLAQSWAVISGAAKEARAKEAMEAVDKALVKEDKGLILLLAPPFDKSKLEPGYIKGYVPGVRENGGQYTHAATWVIMAWTMLGDGNKAWKYYNMINPINHSSNEISARNYKVEPYVMSADVYIKEPHGGRGGWSWYTGASGWMYKVGLEYILGLKKVEGKGYSINPCVPDSWNDYEIWINDDVGEYHLNIKRRKEKADDKIKVIINGNERNDNFIPKNQGRNEIEVFF